MEEKNILEYHRIPVENDIWGIHPPVIFAHSCCAKINGIEVTIHDLRFLLMST